MNSLSLTNNSSLMGCAVPWLCQYLARSGYAVISGNAPSCNYAAIQQGCATAAALDLNVSGAQAISGSYRNVTITGTGAAALSGPLTVSGTLTVQPGGSLMMACQPVTGSGSFALQAGAMLSICDPAGITASGATGAVQLTGTRSFSPDANYVYNGTAAQATGSGLPAQVRNLTVNNAAGVTLSQPLGLSQVLTLTNGNLNTNAWALTLLSSAASTALVVNTNGVVNGTATVQRYISPALNPGTGYRHFSAPVQNTTVADLSTSAFTPVVNPAYNSSATPNQVMPFPTVFGYDQARQATSPASAYSTFDKGWVSPATLADALQPGRGYTVNLSAAQTVDFVGQLNTGSLPLNFVRGAGAEAGWQLVGNPYPAPLDWSRVTVADRRGLSGAIHMYESTGPYVGRYRSYVNGVGNPLVALGQGFFVRVVDSVATGSLTLRDAHRLTAPDATPLLRTTADLRPQLQLQLLGAGTTDASYVYFEAGATSGVDAEYDAHKLPNSTGLNLAALAGTRPLAVSGLPLLTAATVVPLQVAVPAAGTYSLQAAQLLNFAPGTQVYLHDAFTAQDISLQPQTTYSFVHSASSSTGRFSLVFRPSSVTATASARQNDQLSVFPNPTTGSFTLRLAGTVPGKQAEAMLCNVLGQVVRRQTVPALSTGLQAEVGTTGLPVGVYTLRLALADGTFLTKRVVKQ
ncbi:hypothetical protein B0919_12230 [Hymenobacter sp. CRA2]|nr:hypothetical protein B0919_12230 [Hymenobacter sp. CRA2]